MNISNGAVLQNQLVHFTADGKVDQVTDITGQQTTIAYGDGAGAPSDAVVHVTSPDGLWAHVNYDQLGHVTQVSNSRGIATTYSYSYPPSAPAGQLDLVQEMVPGKATRTVALGYDANGWLQTLTSPRPGSTTGETVTTTIVARDALKNPTQITTPGPNGDLAISYNYETDADFPAHTRVGMPVLRDRATRR